MPNHVKDQGDLKRKHDRDVARQSTTDSIESLNFNSDLASRCNPSDKNSLPSTQSDSPYAAVNALNRQSENYTGLIVFRQETLHDKELAHATSSVVTLDTNGNSDSGETSNKSKNLQTSAFGNGAPSFDPGLRLGYENGIASPRNYKDRPPKRLKSAASFEIPPVYFACPYRKYDPKKYGIYDKRICARSQWSSISRLKEHLYRCHKQPLHCKRCLEQFTTVAMFEKHAGGENMCDHKQYEAPEGLTVEVEKALRSRKKSTSLKSNERRWQEIYCLLFPEEREIPSPFFEPISEETARPTDLVNLHDFEEYFQREFPLLASSTIESMLSDSTKAAHQELIKKIIRALQECQGTIFANYRPQPHTSHTTFRASSPQTTSSDSRGLGNSRQESSEISHDLTNLPLVSLDIYTTPYLQDTESGRDMVFHANTIDPSLWQPLMGIHSVSPNFQCLENTAEARGKELPDLDHLCFDTGWLCDNGPYVPNPDWAYLES